MLTLTYISEEILNILTDLCGFTPEDQKLFLPIYENLPFGRELSILTLTNMRQYQRHQNAMNDLEISSLSVFFGVFPFIGISKKIAERNPISTMINSQKSKQINIT